MTYITIPHGDKFAVQNTVDGYILKSKESSSVIAFSDKARADGLRDFFEGHVQQIADASKMWYVKKDGEIQKIWIE